MDLNGDGHQDIISGSYSRQDSDMAGLFQVLWGKEDGSYRKAEALKGTDQQPLIMPGEGADDPDLPRICTRPFAVDWDSDGDLDLVCGNFEGSFFVFEGEGEGKFSPTATKLMVGSSETPLVVSGWHSDPFVVDWDGDGDLDLLSGSGSGGAYWAENTAKSGETPVLKDFAVLAEPPKGDGEAVLKKGDDPAAPAASTRVWADDVDGDGKLDLLVGDSAVLRYPAEGIGAEEFKTKHAEWSAANGQLMKKFQEAGEDREAREKLMGEYHELRNKRQEFVEEERTGFVWLYQRK